jgi:hypothetical protein
MADIPFTIMTFNNHKFINAPLFVSCTVAGFSKTVLKHSARRAVGSVRVVLLLVSPAVVTDRPGFSPPA